MEEKRDIRKFILENHRKFTIKEISAEFGVYESRVSFLLNELGVKCITKAERNKEFIKDNPELTKGELREILGLSKQQLWQYEQDLGIKIPTDMEISSIHHKQSIHESVAEKRAARLKKKEQGGATEFTCTLEEEENLWNIAAMIVEGMTDEEKKRYAEKYVIRRRIPGVIRSDFL